MSEWELAFLLNISMQVGNSYSLMLELNFHFKTRIGKSFEKIIVAVAMFTRLYLEYS